MCYKLTNGNLSPQKNTATNHLDSSLIYECHCQLLQDRHTVSRDQHTSSSCDRLSITDLYVLEMKWWPVARQRIYVLSLDNQLADIRCRVGSGRAYLWKQVVLSRHTVCTTSWKSGSADLSVCGRETQSTPEMPAFRRRAWLDLNPPPTHIHTHIGKSSTAMQKTRDELPDLWERFGKIIWANDEAEDKKVEADLRQTQCKFNWKYSTPGNWSGLLIFFSHFVLCFIISSLSFASE